MKDKAKGGCLDTHLLFVFVDWCFIRGVVLNHVLCYNYRIDYV
jgi:hypothetical protein